MARPVVVKLPEMAREGFIPNRIEEDYCMFLYDRHHQLRSGAVLLLERLDSSLQCIETEDAQSFPELGRPSIALDHALPHCYQI